MSIFNTLLSNLQPPRVVPFSEYEGPQYLYWKLVFRPNEYPYDLYIVAAIILYVGCYFFFKGANTSLVMNWYKKHSQIYQSNFSKTSAKPIKDGPTTFFTFSTGRKNVQTLHTLFELLPRQDLLISAVNTLWGLVNLNYEPKDRLTLDFVLPQSANGNWVWAVISKDVMENQRKERWELTFTKASDNPALPKGTILMSEAADVAESIFKVLSTASGPARHLFSAISDTPGFESLIISDQPSERPYGPVASENKKRYLHLSIAIKKGQDHSTLLNAIFDLIDIISSTQAVPLRPETKNRLKLRRDQLETELRKDAEREQKEVDEENRRSEKRREKDEAISGMSASEQRKAMEKEQKRAIRKAQGKMVKKA